MDRRFDEPVSGEQLNHRHDDGDQPSGGAASISAAAAADADRVRGAGLQDNAGASVADLPRAEGKELLDSIPGLGNDDVLSRLARRCRGNVVLHYWKGSFWVYRDGYYQKQTMDQMETFIDGRLVQLGVDKVNTSKVREV